MGIWNALWPAGEEESEVASAPLETRTPVSGREPEPATRAVEAPRKTLSRPEPAGGEGEVVSVPLDTSGAAPPIEPEPAGGEGEVASVPAGVGGDQEDGQRVVPRWSVACLWAVKLSERLPASAHLTSLSCKASGEYALEGSCFSHGEMEGFLDTLRKFPSRVSLSWWSEGRPIEGQPRQFKFTFQGQFEEIYTRELESLPEARARILGEEIAGWARQCGLEEVSLKAPIEIPLAVDYVQHRQKIWATGSYAQIDAFIERLKQMEYSATLEEVVIVPVFHEGENWKRARLYSAVDVLMHRP
jgi:hypothetical protein